MSEAPSNAKIAATLSVVALLFSTALSGAGIYNSLESLGLPDSIRYILAGTSTGILTTLAFVGWRTFGYANRRRRLRKGLDIPIKSGNIMLLVAVLASVGSVFTSFSALTFINNRDGVQSALNSRMYAGVTQPLIGLSGSYASIAAAAADVRQIAATKSAQEQADGGTCGPTPPGDGPITSLRANHAREASSIAVAANDLADIARGLVEQIAKATTQSEVDSIYQEGLKLITDPRRNEIAQKADSLGAGYKGGGFFWEGDNRNCPDVDMAQSLDRLAESAKGGTDFPSTPPIRRDASVFDATSLNFGLIISPESVTESGLTRSDVIPLMIFAFVVDAIGAVSAFVFGASRARKLTEQERTDYHRKQWILENFLWVLPTGEKAPMEKRGYYPYKAYLFKPEDGDPTKTKDVRTIAAEYGLREMPELQLQPLNELLARFGSLGTKLHFASGGANEFTVYPIDSEDLIDQIQKDKETALLVLGFDHVKSDMYPDFDPSKYQDSNVTHLRKRA